MESSDKPNPRIVLSAHRARNKTVVMGADQLEALRSDAEPSSAPEQVADLLGAVGAKPDYENYEHSESHDALFDVFSNDESLEPQTSEGEGYDTASPATLVEAHSFPDDFQSADEAEILSTLSDAHDAVQHPVDSDGLEALSDRMSSVKTGEELPKTRVIRSGSARLPVNEPVDEVSASDAEGSELSLREKPDAAAFVSDVTPRKDPARCLPPSSNSGGALVGFLVSFDADPKGGFVELREGRIIVSSEKVGAAPCLVIEDSSVSPMHAIIRVLSGEPLYILDQLSEFGTRIQHADTGESESLYGEKGVAKHGDVVLFGEKKFHVCLVSIELGDR
jgi:hypothetical protein